MLSDSGRPQLPTRIEDYQIGAVIGRGGFAVVHQAVSKHRNSYGADVAIKMIDKDVISRSNLTSRVQTELSIHSALSHPSILQLHTFFESQTHVYLVTELCPHGELYRYIQQRKGACLSEAEARTVMDEIVQGVLYLHSQGIIHRDLKLSNVLLTKDYHMKIADFGLAAKLHTMEGEQKTMCGTPNYISPEIVSRQPYGLSSDLWSLGCMLVTILTGKPPFDSQAVKSTLDKVSRAEYHLPDSISADARDLIGKLLMKDPKKRLTLRDILAHRWFSYPKLPLQIDRPESASSSRSTKEIRNDALQQNRFNVMAPRNAEGNFQQQQHQQQSKPVSARGSSFIASAQPAAILSQTAVHHNDLKTISSNLVGHDSDQKKTSTPPFNTRQSFKTDSAVTNASETHLQFSTIRLKAIQQKTKHGLVSILDDGNVTLDLDREKYLVVISGDSSLIQLCDRSNRSPIQTYSSATYAQQVALPATLSKLLNYASRFVHLVASKTPKIIFYSPQAKCLLMENGDFEMVFYNGAKVAYRGGKTGRHVVVFKSASGDASTKGTLNPAVEQREFDLSDGTVQIPAHLAVVFKHMQECLRQCLDIEEQSVEGGASGIVFPLILKSSNISNAGGSATAPGQAGYAAVSSKGHSPIPSVHASVVSSTVPSVRSGFPTNQAEAIRAKSRSSITIGAASTLYTPEPKSKYAETAVSTLTRVHGPPQTTPSLRATPSVAQSSTLAGTGSKRVVGAEGGRLNSTSFSDPAFLDGVGWCSRDGEGRFNMLFNDGVQMIVDSRDQNLVWTNVANGMQDERFKISAALPQHIKAKLSHFPTFMTIFRKRGK
ncbi:hypothetical protein HDU77_002003 [Chytriomyces hyalinus]|nr:hypothetical protein HDU77_002003 [Chytriomyces hyalinus]